MSRILPLPQNVIEQIQSSHSITSLQQVVLSLLENSLDAGSSKINVSVDFTRGSCTVEDDGSGIPPAEFEEDGGLGKMYHTSKQILCTERELHGSAGTFLSALAALSYLSITSCSADGSTCSSLTLHNGRIIKRLLPESDTGDGILAHPLYRTQVEVRDLFGNMPVRVKQRALRKDGQCFYDHAWRELKHGVVALLLAWPDACSVRLHDTGRERRGIHLCSSTERNLTEQSLRRLEGHCRTFNLQDRVPTLLQAGLLPTESSTQFVPVSASTIDMSLKGLVGLHPAAHKRCQFISIGVHPCDASSGYSELYAAINTVFSHSSFASIDDCSNIDEAETERRKRDGRFKKNGYTRKQLHVRKGVDRWPVFVVQIRLKHSDWLQDAQSLSERLLQSIIQVLQATFTQWLEAHHLRPRKRKGLRNEAQEGPCGVSNLLYPSSTLPRGTFESTRSYSPKRAVTADATFGEKRRRLSTPVQRSSVRSAGDCFNSWSRIKSAKNTFYDELWQGKATLIAPSDLGRATLLKHARSLESLTFSLPVAQVGELSARTAADRQSLAPSNQGILSPRANRSARETQHWSSDTYGSFDEECVLAAINPPGENDNPPSTVAHGKEKARQNSYIQLDEDGLISWQDPVLKRQITLNARTGIVVPLRTNSNAVVDTKASAGVHAPSRLPLPSDRNRLPLRKPLSLSRRFPSEHQHNESIWLRTLLQDWDNPVFSPQRQERISAVPCCLPGNDDTMPGHILGDTAPLCGPTTKQRLEKADLQKARVISQVDRKFILCAMHSNIGHGSESLVLVDQHAASERIILEGMLNALCTEVDLSAPGNPRSASTGVVSAVFTTALEKAVSFQISENELNLFQQHAPHFAHWGIIYDLSDRPSPGTASQVRTPPRESIIAVRALPPAIAGRCINVPKVLIELLRSEIWHLSESSRPRALYIPPQNSDVTMGKTETDEKHWLRRLGSCPKGILDMVNSRACRSAIMFNDELSHAQCQELVADLSRCAFPFMCAHGRVSVVPLADVEIQPGYGELSSFAVDKPAANFVDAFKRWQTVAKD